MTFWETLFIAVIPALITGIITYFVAVKQNRYEIKKIEKQVENNLIEYNSKELLEIKRKAVFDSLALIDTYISWLTIDNGNVVAERKNVTKIELTEIGRKCYNELCLTCKSEELIKLFSEIMFKKDKNIFELYAKYRNAARKELELNEIEFDLNRVFIGRLATENMTK